VVHIDDLLIADDDDTGIDRVIAEINPSLKVKEIGQPSRFLGYRIPRDSDKGSVTISQQACTKDLLKSTQFPIPTNESPSVVSKQTPFLS
jgi:hypothetical protein